MDGDRAEGTTGRFGGRVWLVAALAVSAGFGGGLAAGFLLPHTTTQGSTRAVINGTTYNVLTDSFTRGGVRPFCPGGSTPLIPLYSLSWGNARFDSNLLPESCNFPTVNGSFVFSVNITVTVASPGSSNGWQETEWVEHLAFENGSGGWSNLSVFVDQGKCGVEYFPTPQSGAPAQGMSGNGGLMDYTFWFLYAS